MNALGKHILVEFFGCSSEILNDVIKIEQGMVDAANACGATVINSTFHHFSPYGVSGVVVIQESHLAIHTWPEYQYAAVDLFTCGDQVDAWIAFDHLKKTFEADNGSAMELNRGPLPLLERVDFKIEPNRTNPDEAVIKPTFKRNVWFTDKDDNIANSLRHTGELLFREDSPYQRVEVLNTYAYGKMLTIDNMVMTTEKDEYVYHEMLVHPSIFSHRNVKNVLVIGAGDGGTIRELVRHSSIEKIEMVEIDEAVIRASKEFLPEISCALEHEKLNLTIGDGIEFVKNSADKTYDLVIVDGSDPVGPAEGLFSVDFYKNVHRILKDDGFVATQNESPRFNQKAFIDTNHCMNDIFGKENVHPYLAYIPTYPSGMWSFIMASKVSFDPIDTKKINQFSVEQDLNYYDGDMHHSAFTLPIFVRKMLK